MLDHNVDLSTIRPGDHLYYVPRGRKLRRVPAQDWQRVLVVSVTPGDRPGVVCTVNGTVPLGPDDLVNRFPARASAAGRKL